MKNKPPLRNVDLPNFYCEFTLAESSKGGTMIYIHKNLRYIQVKERFTFTNQKQWNQHL